MEDSFNPYTHWLNIPAGHPSNHYELLGLPLGENDSRAIAQAADTAIAQVRRIRPGNRLYEWKQVLDTLEQAKTCLLDPEAKADYDGRLRGFVGHDPTIPPASPVVPGAKMAVPPSPAPYTPPRRPAQSQAVPSPASLPQGSLPPGNENPPPATIPVGSPLSPSNQPALPRGIPVPPAGSLPPQASPLAHEPPTTEVSATPALKSVKRKKRSARRYWILGALIVWLLVLGGAVYYAVDQVTQRLEAMHLAQSQAVLVEEDVSPLPSSRQVPSSRNEEQRKVTD